MPSSELEAELNLVHNLEILTEPKLSRMFNRPNHPGTSV